ncbi:uncharacterized protein [Dysidea avara]|uniref:uncharacterized protein n=1 Tax=Dysidea avara TaxID=196820 RepID=UPI0033278056
MLHATAWRIANNKCARDNKSRAGTCASINNEEAASPNASRRRWPPCSPCRRRIVVPLTRDSSTAMSTISVNDADFLWCINYLLKQNFWETKDKFFMMMLQDVYNTAKELGDTPVQ